MDWRAFHDFTNHRPDSHGGKSDDPSRPQSMDPARRPEPFKTYPEALEAIPLHWEIERWVSGQKTSGSLDIDSLSRILLIGAGAKKYRSPWLRGRYFRTYASAGALHPNEVYVAAPDSNGIDAGLFHLDPKERRLMRLGRGDPRGVLSRAANDDELASMGIVIVISGIPWRTSWKYGPRGYRHLWWDAGMIIANLLALAAAADHPVKVSCMFDDDAVNDLIGVDGRSEMALALVGIGTAPSGADASFQSLKLIPAPLGPHPFEFPEISAVHAATSQLEKPRPPASARVTAPPGSSVERAIWKRGSTREFDEEGSISADQLIQILRYADQPLPVDWHPPTNEFLLIAHSADDYEPGAYRWNGSSLELVRKDPESRDSGHFLSLRQDLGAEGAATIFPMADLDDVTGNLGPRGYRAAQLEGAIRSGLIYLAASGQEIGATGLTFYDEEVSKYFGVQSTPMLEVAIGRRLPAPSIKEPTDEPQNLELADATIEDGVPKGWRGRVKGYSCEVADGTLVVRSASHRSSWCNVGQTVKVASPRGEKVSVSVEVATDLSPQAWVGLYATVNDTERSPVSMDNMQDRPIKGNTAFSRYSIELPLGEEAASVGFGVILVGEGEAKARAFHILIQ